MPSDATDHPRLNQNHLNKENTMSYSMPAWLEPELFEEAIQGIREGDHTRSNEWLKLITSRYAAITQTNMDQIQAALRDLNTTAVSDQQNNKDVL